MLRRTSSLVMPFALLLAFAGAHASPLLFPQVATPQAPASKPETKTGKLATTFDKAELEAWIAELCLYIPESADLEYPINADFVKTKNVNAYATAEFQEGKKPRAVMRVLTGILGFIDDLCEKQVVVGLDPNDPSQKVRLKPGDERRLLRAVIAHELGHLSKTHVLVRRDSPTLSADMGVLYTRETEQEADMVGAAALQRAGYSRKDAEHMLLMLESQGGAVSTHLLNDHADGKRRALSVATDPKILRALIEYDMGLAFSEVRQYGAATLAFDRAIVREPRLIEAYINAAQTAGLNYYEGLAIALRKDWFRPDFGPLFGSPLSAPKAGKEVTTKDQERYAEAEKRAALALQKAPSELRALEIAGLIGVLTPRGDASKIATGLTNLNKALAMATDPSDRIRIANNIAVGQQRSGEVAKGIETLVTTFRMTERYNAAGAANLGFAAFPASQKANAGLAASVLHMYLTSTPIESEDYAPAKARYEAILSTYSLKGPELPKEGVRNRLLLAYSLVDGGQELTYFDPYESVEKKLGKGIVAIGIKPSGDNKIQEGKPVGVFEAKYRGGAVTALFNSRLSSDGETENRLLARATSYSPGAYVELRPSKPEFGEPVRVSVGMARTALDARFPLKQSVTVRLFRVGTLEEWSYFPALGFGVQMKDDKVAALTVTPIKLD